MRFHKSTDGPPQDEPGTPEASRSDFRPDIEGLRGLAIALVVLFHACSLSGLVVLSGGFLGVDLFFVISGFLITGLLLKEYNKTGAISFARFYARRVRRILPAALLVLVVSLPLCLFLLPPLERPSVLLDGVASALSIGNIRLALSTNYFSQVIASPFVHFWSLGVEEQFYLVWPALIVVAAYFGRRFLRGRGDRGILILLILIIVASFAGNLALSDYSPTMAFYYLPTRAWQLALGGLLAYLSIKPALGDWISQHFHRGAFCGWLALGLLIFLGFCFDSGLPVAYPGLYALTPTVAGLVLIATGRNPQGPARLLTGRPMRYLGKISYSLYLWHWPVLIFGVLFFGGPLAQTINPEQAALLVLISTVLATFSWLLVEEPARRGRLPFKETRLPLPAPGRLVGVGLSAMVLTAIFGAQFYWQSQSVLAEVVNSDSTSAYAINADITPSLSGAANDYELPILDGCYATENISVPAYDRCIYGDKMSNYSVALIGDSHASALFPAVNFVAQAQGWRLEVLVKSGCRFSDLPLYNYILERSYRECATWNAAVMAHLSANPPDLVIVSMSSFDVNLNSADNGYVASGQGVGRELAKLPRTTQVIIIADPPMGLESMPVCLSVHFEDYRRCAFPRAASGTKLGLREAIAAAYVGGTVISLTDQICPGLGDCPALIDNMIVWRDDQHLTATFARSLGPVLEQRILRSLSNK